MFSSLRCMVNSPPLLCSSIRLYVRPPFSLPESCGSAFHSPTVYLSANSIQFYFLFLCLTIFPPLYNQDSAVSIGCDWVPPGGGAPNSPNKVAIVEAGGIDPLVRLLTARSTPPARPQCRSTHYVRVWGGAFILDKFLDPWETVEEGDLLIVWRLVIFYI